MTEREAEDAILSWCRSGKRGIGVPVMRHGANGERLVLDLSAREPIPGAKYDWEMREKTLASAPTWVECLEILRKAGKEL